MAQHSGSPPPRSLLAVAMVVGLVVAACAGETATTAPTAAPTAAPTGAPTAEPTEAPSADPLADLKAKLQGQTVKIGSSASPNASVIGFFKAIQYLEEDFGVNVEEQLLDSDPLIAAMISGQVQIGQLSLSGTANANNQGANFVAFGVDDQKNLFLVAAKKPTATIAELRGQTFGATQNLNQITGQTARRCLGTAGLDIEKDVQLIRFNNTGEVTAAVRSGQVVAGISASFRLTRVRLEDGDTINVLCNGYDANPSISSVWMADRDWVAANGDMALALIISEIKGARWSKTDKAGWIELAKSVIEGYTDEAGEIDYQNIVIEADNWPVNGGLEKGICQSTLDTSFEFGAIDRQLQCEDIADFSFQERALEILGRQ